MASPSSPGRRELAQRSAKAATEIEAVISTSGQQVDGGVGLSSGQILNNVTTPLHYLDHTWAETLREWLKREKKMGHIVEIQHPPAGRHPRLSGIFERLPAEVA